MRKNLILSTLVVSSTGFASGLNIESAETEFKAAVKGREIIKKIDIETITAEELRAKLLKLDSLFQKIEDAGLLTTGPDTEDFK